MFGLCARCGLVALVLFHEQNCVFMEVSLIKKGYYGDTVTVTVTLTVTVSVTVTVTVRVVKVTSY